VRLRAKPLRATAASQDELATTVRAASLPSTLATLASRLSVAAAGLVSMQQRPLVMPAAVASLAKAMDASRHSINAVPTWVSRKLSPVRKMCHWVMAGVQLN